MTAEGESTGARSDAVEELYRDYPYPGHGVISAVAARMLGPTIARARARVTGRRVRLLDAGCGTGEQALGIARAFPDVEVTGVDFSEASLRMARELAGRSGLGVRFERGDLMKPLEGLDPFDIVVSIGVLHHLPDPAIGFGTLRGVVAEDGQLFGMVYGTFGKWSTFQLRDALRMIGRGRSRPELLDLLREAKLADNTGPLHYVDVLLRRARFGPSIPVGEAIRRTFAGRSGAYQADTFTHVREATYTWSELAATLARAGFRFDGWPKRSGMPDEPRQLFRGAALDAMRGLDPLEQAGVYERIVRPLCLYFVASATPTPAPGRQSGK